MTGSPLNPPQYRKAELRDVVQITRWLRQFYSQASPYNIPFDYESAIASVEDTVNRGVVLIGSSSCAGALLTDFPFNNRARIAYILFWYFRSAREITILNALCDACRTAGATHVNVSSLFPHNRVGRFYEKRGFKAVETQWLIALNCSRV
jgi:hypothetical protein